MVNNRWPRTLGRWRWRRWITDSCTLASRVKFNPEVTRRWFVVKIVKVTFPAWRKRLHARDTKQAHEMGLKRARPRMDFTVRFPRADSFRAADKAGTFIIDNDVDISGRSAIRHHHFAADVIAQGIHTGAPCQQEPRQQNQHAALNYFLHTDAPFVKPSDTPFYRHLRLVQTESYSTRELIEKTKTAMETLTRLMTETSNGGGDLFNGRMPEPFEVGHLRALIEGLPQTTAASRRTRLAFHTE